MADPETTPLFCPRWQFLVLLAQWCQDAGRISQLWVLSLFLVPVMKNIDSYDRESVWRSILDGVSAADNYSHQDIQDMSSSKTGRRGLYMLVGRITSSKTSLRGYYLQNFSRTCISSPSAVCCEFCRRRNPKHREEKPDGNAGNSKSWTWLCNASVCGFGEGFFFFFFAGILWVHARPFSSPVGLQLGGMQWCGARGPSTSSSALLLREITQLTSPTLCFTQHAVRFSPWLFPLLLSHHFLLLSLLSRSPFALSAPPPPSLMLFPQT